MCVLNMCEKSSLSYFKIQSCDLEVVFEKQATAPFFSYSEKKNDQKEKEDIGQDKFSKDDNLKVVTSPYVGIIHIENSKELVGKLVYKGETICTIEAMKLYNNIECEIDGTVEEVFVNDGKEVEFGEKIMTIREVTSEENQKSINRK